MTDKGGTIFEAKESGMSSVMNIENSIFECHTFSKISGDGLPVTDPSVPDLKKSGATQDRVTRFGSIESIAAFVKRCRRYLLKNTPKVFI